MSSTSSECSQSSSPVASNAPKFGTLVPNRIFVGGIAANTTEAELSNLFSSYGKVKGTKIISDRAGVSKGYGFVTFETEEEATRIQKEAANIFLKDRKLNIAPAIKKQPLTRIYDPIHSTQNGTVLYHNGVPYTYHNGVAFFTNPHDNIYQIPQPQATAYPVVYPQPAIYVPQQQYSYQATPNSSMPTQYVYAVMPASTPNSPLASSSQPPPSATSCATSVVTAPVTNSQPTGRPEYYTVFSSLGGAIMSPPQNAISLVPSYLYHPIPGSPAGSDGTPGIPNIEYSDMEPVGGTEGGDYGGARNLGYASSYGGGAASGTFGSPPKASYCNPSEPNQVKPSYGRSSHGHSTRYGQQQQPAGQTGPSGLFGTTPSNGGGDILKTRTYKRIHGAQPHLIPKSINGVTVMAYPVPTQQDDRSPYRTEAARTPSSGIPMTPPNTPMTPTSTSAIEEPLMKLQGLKL